MTTRSANGEIFIKAGESLAGGTGRLSGVLVNSGVMGAKIMAALPEKYDKKRLCGWKMNPQQRRFLESLLNDESSQLKAAVASAPANKKDPPKK
ncbi:hypothetical protein [Kalamiella sp. sgz302252]|uniref:hypothetical protein n=1 Tax=Pantoea sp. sgz302252 TaxID=3341827 RepID=UPI0036D42C73